MSNKVSKDFTETYDSWLAKPINAVIFYFYLLIAVVESLIPLFIRRGFKN